MGLDLLSVIRRAGDAGASADSLAAPTAAYVAAQGSSRQSEIVDVGLATLALNWGASCRQSPSISPINRCECWCLIARDTFAIGDTQIDASALLTFVANRVLIVPFELASCVHLVVHAIDLPQLGYRLEISLAVGARACLSLLAFDRLKGMHNYLF